MNDTEEKIYNLIINNGLSSSTIVAIKENLTLLTSNFLTEIITDNVNIYTNFQILIEFLPIVWDDNKNSSNHLINYINGISHRLFYFAREYPLGKEPPEYLKEEIEMIHQGLHNFKAKCIQEEIPDKDINPESINSFEDLIDILEQYPRFPTKLYEMFQIVASLFYQFALNKNQQLSNIDELLSYLARCLIFWRLQALTDQELVACFSKARKNYQDDFNLTEMEEILALELQNYQFLQLGIDRKLVKIIVYVFQKLK